MEEKIKALYNDKDFTEKLSLAKSFDEAAALFASHGVVISAQELADIAKEALAKDGDDLSEEMLDQVSGGGFLTAVGLLVGGYVVGRLIEKYTR